MDMDHNGIFIGKNCEKLDRTQVHEVIKQA